MVKGEQEPQHTNSPWRGLEVLPLNTVVGEGLESTLFTQGTRLSRMKFHTFTEVGFTFTV